MTARALTKDEIKALQRVLADRGLYAGEIDGKFGDMSREALRMVQEDLGHPVTGAPTYELLLELGVITPPQPKPRSNPITDFITKLVAQKGAEFIVNKLKGLPQMNVLAGYRTYILAALIVLCSLAETFVGVDIPEFNMGLGEAIAVALGLFTARVGATNEAAKVAGK